MIVQGAIAAFRICGLPDPDPAKVRENIGKPLAIALDEYMPPGFNVTPNEISEAYRSWYASEISFGVTLKPGGIYSSRAIARGFPIFSLTFAGSGSGSPQILNAAIAPWTII